MFTENIKYFLQNGYLMRKVIWRSLWRGRWWNVLVTEKVKKIYGFERYIKKEKNEMPTQP